MSPTEYFRLFVLGLCLLDSGANCEDTQKGYDLHVQAGETPKAVHSDGDHKRWSELSILRIPTAGFKSSSVARGQSGSQPTQEDHTTDSTLTPYPAHRNVPKGQGAVVHDRSGTKAFSFPEGKKIHQANSESVFSTDAVQVGPHSYRLSRTKLTGGFSPQAEEAPVGFGPSRRALIYSRGSTESSNIKAIKSESHKTNINPSRPNTSHLPTWPEVSGNPGSSSAGIEETSEARGYAHVCHMKPSNDKTQPQASSAAGRKFLETGNPFVMQHQGRCNHDSSERRPTLNYKTRGKQSSSWHPRTSSIVQGKFKPFQRLSRKDPPPHHHPPEMEPTPTAAGTTLSPCLNSTGITSSVVPSVDGELSTTSASPMQTESQDGESNATSASPMQRESQDGGLNATSASPMQTASQDGGLNTTSASPMQTASQDGGLNTTSASPMQTESQNPTLVPQASNHDGQSESSAEVGPSMEKDKPLTVFPLTVHPAEEEKGDTVVLSPSEKDESED